MIRHDSLVICDAHIRKAVDDKGKEIYHSIVVNDGVTILQGWIQVLKGKVYEWFSSDKNGFIKDNNGNSLLTSNEIGTYKKKKVKADFCNAVCYEKWLEDQKK